MPLTVSATDTEVQKPVNVAYQQNLLRNALPLAPYMTGTTAGQISRNAGTATIKWRRYNTSADNASGISPSTTALSELTGNASYMQGRTPATVHFSDVTATVSKYGQFFILNEEVDVFLPNGTMMGITDTLGITAGRSKNQLQRDVIEDNVTLVQAGGAASDATQESAITAAAIHSVVNTLTRNSAMPFTAQSGGSTNVGSSPMLPGYWALTHPDVAYDVSQLTGFISVAKYISHTATVPGEFGAFDSAGYTVRFIQTPEASIDTDSGASSPSAGLRATSAVDLYTTVIYGRDAVGSVGLGRRFSDGIFRAGEGSSMDGIEMIAKGVGTGNLSGTDDPFNEITTLAYKFYHAGALLNSSWARGIRSGATSL